MNGSVQGEHRLDSSRWALTRVTDDVNLAASLRRVALAGCELSTNCVSSSVTVILAGRAATMAATDDAACAVDQAQYTTDDGPCLSSARHERLVRMDDLSVDDRWPAFRLAAMRFGLASSLSVPLLLEDADTFGALNLYSAVTHGFSAANAADAETFAEQAAVVVANVVAYWTALDLSSNLSAAMEHRGVIEQAKGIVMAVNRCNAEDAFDVLRRQSQAANRKLRDIAIDVVQSVHG